MFYLLFAFNYFAFRTELFSEEYEQNHPNNDPFTKQVAVSLPTLNWETFDKDNAPKAFVFLPPLKTVTIGIIPKPSFVFRIEIESTEPVRDKSPPQYPII